MNWSAGKIRRTRRDLPGLSHKLLPSVLSPALDPLLAAQVAFVITHRTGRAQLWGTAEWERQSGACASFAAFSEELRKVFGLTRSRTAAVRGLMPLRQGQRSVADFSMEFQTITINIDNHH